MLYALIFQLYYQHIWQFNCNTCKFVYIQINSLSSFGSEHMATCSDDGTLRLWTVASREQALQFQVLDQVDLNSLFKDKLNLIP